MEKDLFSMDQNVQKESAKDIISEDIHFNQNTVSNIELSQVDKNGNDLPEGYSWDAHFENGRICDGIVTILDEDGCLHEQRVYQNGKLNGICSYFDSGELVGKKTFVDGVEEGWACKLHMSYEVKWFLYENGSKKVELVKSDKMKGYWDAVAMDSHEKVSCCQYDANHEAFGKGYLYEHGRISRVVVFENGEIVEVLKEFRGDVMVEYDENKVKVYEGGYGDGVDYPREGEGKEYKNGVIVYKGSWKKDKREGYGKSVKNGVAEYMGNWKEGVPHGEGVFMKDNEMLYEGKWVKGRYLIEDGRWFDFESGEIVLSSDEESEGLYNYLWNESAKEISMKKIGMKYSEIVDMREENKVKSALKERLTPKELNKSIREKVKIQSGKDLMNVTANGKQIVVEMEILADCGNELEDDLDICGFEKLESISVGRNSLKNLRRLRIMNNPELKSITVKDGCFNKGAFENVKSIEISSELSD